MEMNQNIQDRIDEYLNGTLTEADKAAFEKELLENDELREEVEAQRTIAEAVQAVHLRNMLEGVEAGLHRRHTLRRVIAWTSSAAAAVAITLSGYSLRQSSLIKAIGSECFAELTPLSPATATPLTACSHWHIHRSRPMNIPPRHPL